MDYEVKRQELANSMRKTMEDLSNVRVELREKSAKSRALIKAVYEAQTSVKIATAEAFSMIEGEGKNAYAMLGEKVFSCSNEQLRSAFVTTYAEPHIKAQAKAEGDKSANDAEVFALKDELNAIMAMLRAQTAEIESFGKNADLLVISRRAEVDKAQYENRVQIINMEAKFSRDLTDHESDKKKELLDLELKLCEAKDELLSKELDHKLLAINKKFDSEKELMLTDSTLKKELLNLQVDNAIKIAKLSEITNGN